MKSFVFVIMRAWKVSTHFWHVFQTNFRENARFDVFQQDVHITSTNQWEKQNVS
jgi:hypothetical protein